MSETYKQGFDAGYKFSIENWDPHTGNYSKSLPIEFNNGFVEGLISGRRFILDVTFPGYKKIYWPNRRAKVLY